MRMTSGRKRRALRAAAVTLVAASAVCLGVASTWAGRQAPSKAPYRSPESVAFSPDGRRLAVADSTANEVALVDVAQKRVGVRVPIAEPTAVLWQGGRIYAAEHSSRSVAEIDATTGRVVRRLGVGYRPAGLALAAKSGLLVVTNSGTNDVSIVDLASGKERARIGAGGEPFCAAVTRDGKTALVGNLVPLGDSTDAESAARLTVIDLTTLKRTASIRMPAGSTNVRDIRMSADGKWAYIAHALGRFNLPTTQLDRGWVNTNTLSVFDLGARKVYATLLLDHPMEGSADPWGLALSQDGGTAWIALAGVHTLARVNLAGLHPLMAGKLPDSSPLARKSDEWAITSRNIWQEIKDDPKKRDELVNDLAALYQADLIETTPMPGKAPRGIAMSPDGATVAVPLRFTGVVAMVSTKTGKSTGVVSLGPSRPVDLARKGEQMFHDGNLCFQHWLSCATCHPDGRTDGLNWDLLNDGIGNPKNTRSMLNVHRRTPVMSHGVRSDYKAATVAGFRFILFREPEKGEPEAVQAYFRSLTPVRSPYVTAGGGLSARALRGKVIFESKQAGCGSCHTGRLHSDQRITDVGTKGPFDNDGKFVTSTLVEVWRTAPYLHDGRAVTMAEVFTKYNKAGKHGKTSHLKPEQIKDLAEYVLSL